MIAVIDYASGNVKSVENAVQKLGFETVVTSDEATIRNAEKVIFPGVGEASTAMENLKLNQLDILIPTLTQPFLGICLGQQLLCGHSEEGNTTGLGIFDSTVKKFHLGFTVPHMGWNSLSGKQGQMFDGIKEEEDFYFVHSYYCTLGPDTTSVCDYITPFSATMQRNNFFGTQFHPEKSGSAGSMILKNFLQTQL